MTIKVQLKREVNGVMQQVNPITSEECVILGDGKKLNEVIDFATTAEDFVDETIVIEENLVDRVESMENKIETEFEQQNSQITTGLSNIKTIEQNISNKVDTEVAKVNAQLSDVNVKIDDETLKYLNKIRSKKYKKMKNIEFPDSFKWDWVKTNIFTDGFNFKIDLDIEKFKVAGGITYFVEVENGSDSNDGLTFETPFKTVNAAYLKATDGDTIRIISDKGAIFDRSEIGERYWRKKINLISDNKVIFFGGDKVSFEKDEVYTNLLKTNKYGVVKVVQILDDFPLVYKYVSSLEICNQTPFSFSVDSSNNLYVNNGGGENYSRLLLIMNLNIGLIHIPCTSENMSIYFENIDFYGGASCINATNNANYPDLEVYAKNCRFFAPVGDNNAITLCGSKSIFYNCECHFAERDGFNYHSANGVSPTFIEIKCVGGNNGNNDRPSPNTFNGSTAHDGGHGIRVECCYYNNFGGNVVDVKSGGITDTQTLNFGCISYDSASTNESMNVDFAIQDQGAEMWLYGCKAFGSKWSLNVNSLSTIHVDEFTEYITTTGNGSIGTIG